MHQAYDVSKERGTLLMWQPFMIGLSFNIQQYDIAAAPPSRLASDPETMAFTNGQVIYFGKKYAALTQPEKNFVYLHELMHAIFKHPLRMARIYLQRGLIYAVLANYASDAIINEAIIADKSAPDFVFAIPESHPPIRMSTIHRMMDEAIALVSVDPPASYDPEALHGQNFETVYEWLVWAYEAVKAHRQDESGGDEPEEAGSGDGQAGAGPAENAANDDEAGDEEQAPQTEIERIMQEEEAWDVEDNVEEIIKALVEEGDSPDLIDTCNKKLEEARARLQNVIQGEKVAGTGKGGTVLLLEGDLPASIIAWNRFIRKVIAKELSTGLATTYARQGPLTRSCLALGRRAPATPGTTIFTDRPRILFAIDVSGSNVAYVKQCFAEVWSLASKRMAAIDVVTFDDGVQEIIEIKHKRDFDKVLKNGVRGGGGTSLANLFMTVKGMRTPYRAVVIATDGYLTPPSETEGLSILWVVTPGGTTSGLEECGDVVVMPQLNQEAA
ncbi:DUF2201 family putative metallopeptidase [Croceicoccus gelatinilyticus]|uniref:DUF2201 family putative metallopeptidase n=1 Tax=Croceicoccus gelatinilyticus TaxID=2835536 RepID=UPI001BCDC6A4|nr:VWA-like domain-containing protein [Croceicoccus gelatinilyticus]MBS7671728.1 hypothetical protein [Croceicoccus gelatinilyticus]